MLRTPLSNAPTGSLLTFYREISCFFKRFGGGDGLEIVHPCVRRAFFEGLFQGAKGVLGPEGLHFHGAAPEVSRPSGETERAGRADDEVPETHALHPAVHDPTRSSFLHAFNHSTGGRERPAPGGEMRVPRRPKPLSVLYLWRGGAVRRAVLASGILFAFVLFSGCGQKGDPRPLREIHKPGKKSPPPPVTQPEQPEKPAHE